MDKYLPGVGSFEAIRLIRSIISLSVIPIVFLPDYPRRAERYRAFEAGCDEYPVKPPDLDRLDSSLEKFLFQTPGRLFLKASYASTRQLCLNAFFSY